MPASTKGPTEVTEDTLVKEVTRPQPLETDAPTVKITVTKFGAGKVSTGVHVGGKGDIFAKRGDVFQTDIKTAEYLEARGFAERD